MIGTAILGCGRIGRMHAENLARHPRLRLVSLYDPIATAAAETAARLGCETAPSIDAVLNDSRIKAILIATPTDTHVDLILQAAVAGMAILCEKPIGLDIARVEWCRTELAHHPVPILIGFNRRFDPTFRALRDRLHAGEIGPLEQLLITSRDPAPPPAAYIATSGGLFRDMTIHDFDMARYLAGPIVAVTALGANLIEPTIAEHGDIDAAMITLRAASGALIHINNSRRCAYGYDQRLEAFGPIGMLQAANHHPTTVQSWNETRTQAQDPALHFFIERYRSAYLAELDHFADLLEHRAPSLATFADGLEALRLADAALESLQSGKLVALPPPPLLPPLPPGEGRGEGPATSRTLPSTARPFPNP